MKTETDIDRYTDLNPLTYDMVTYHMEGKFHNKSVHKWFCFYLFYSTGSGSGSVYLCLNHIFSGLAVRSCGC